LLVPGEYLGAALSWLVVLHVLLAGACMYLYARHQGLDGIPALLAAVGFMLAGKWLLHVLLGGHYNNVPLAWLPLVLLLVERAIERGGWLRAVAAGVCFAPFPLAAYPYTTLYAGLFVAIWTLGAALPLGRRGLLRWAGLGVVAATIALLLSAVQLLPNLEVARYASRNLGVVFSPEKGMIDGMRTLLGLAGPPLVTDISWAFEDRGGFGVLGLGLALLAPWLDPRPRVVFWFRVTVGWFVAALIGAYFFQAVPGFHFFRIASRLLLVAGLPVALLGAISVQALLRGPAAAVVAECRKRFLLVVVVVMVLPVAHAVTVYLSGATTSQGSLYWYAAPVLAVLGWYLLGVRTPGAVWAVLLVGELFLVAQPAVQVRTDRDIFTPSAILKPILDADGPGRVVAAPPVGMPSAATPLWPDLAMVLKVEAVGGFNPIDVLRYKEYLQMLGGEDRPLRALEAPYTEAVLGEVVIAKPALADLLGIRYVLLPSERPLETVVPSARAREQWRKLAVDPKPMTFNFIPRVPVDLTGKDCGYFALPPYTLYENQNVLPRAFVVRQAAPLPTRKEVLEALTKTDFRRTVLLENWSGEGTPPAEGGFTPAKIVEYLPNRITLDVDGAGQGYLVLADVWFPGWRCEVDGQPVTVRRANFLFRGIELPAGARRVVFAFEPTSLAWGQWISGVTLAVLLLLFAVAALRRPAPMMKG
jgi:hypothetical protein